MREWLTMALRSSIASRAVKVALLVGTALVIINQGDALYRGDWTVALMAKIVLTYCVPYAVSTYASVSALRDQVRSRARG